MNTNVKMFSTVQCPTCREKRTVIFDSDLSCVILNCVDRPNTALEVDGMRNKCIFWETENAKESKENTSAGS